jgi:hypothetical protein
VTKQIVRNSTLAILVMLLGTTTSRTLTHYSSVVTPVSQAANNGPGGGEPDPTDPNPGGSGGGGLVKAVSLAANNGPGGGEPDPTDPNPGGGLTPTVHLS